MKSKNKILSAVLAAVLLFTASMGLSSCKSGGGEKSGKLSVVTTVFAEYDWVLEILGDKADRAEITMLLDGKSDMHSFQPSASDILKISACDLFIYVGGESDSWAKDVLKTPGNQNRKVLCLMDILGDKAYIEEAVEGMEDDEHENENEGEDEDEDENEDGEHGHEEEEAEYDEHVWLSLRNASLFCDAIEEALSALDPENSEVYKSNLKTYKDKLSLLNGRYESAVGAAGRKTLLFADRFPFRYLTEDYGLSYYAAFSGCSAESEASFETVLFLAKKVDELKLPAVLTIGGNRKIAETVVSSTESRSAEILTLDSLQTTTVNDRLSGKTYLSVMTDNLEVLKTALS